MSAKPADVIPISQKSDGLSHDEFMAVNGLVPMPALPVATKPLPMVFDAAVKAVAACRTIDEAKYWDNRSDALAAWAKIYSDDAVSREARSLKLHAYRRMGQIAESLRPLQNNGRYGRTGPNSLLIAHGFKKTGASEVLKIARLPDARFREIANSARPPSPSTAFNILLQKNVGWARLRHKIYQTISQARNADLDALARSMNTKERNAAIKMVDELCELLGMLQGYCAEEERTSQGKRSEQP